MGIIELIVLALGLAMDAFAVSICLGLGMKKVKFKHALIVGLYFGVFQGLMPLIGYLVASLFADKIEAFDHWVVFALLLFLGAKMIWGALKKDDEPKSSSLSPRSMIPYAIATSIDALAVGISLAFVGANLAVAVVSIGVITLAACMLGVKLGNVFGAKHKSKAEIIGGIVLILIGIKVLIEHLAVLG